MKRILGWAIIGIMTVVLISMSIGIRKFNHSLFKERANHLTVTMESKKIAFSWATDSIGGYFEPQAAIVIPLTLEGLSHHFYFQFDTGSPDSYIYEKDYLSLRNMGYDLHEIELDGDRYVYRLKMTLGGVRTQIDSLKILPNYGHTFEAGDTMYNIKIGTLGSDMITDKVTSIDFVNQKIQLFDNRPKWMNDTIHFSPFDFIGRRIMLPIKMDNKNYEFLYDSGCSAFGLITTKQRYEKYTDTCDKQVSYDANSWGTALPIVSKQSSKLFELGNRDIPLKRVSFLDMYTFIQPLVTPFTRIGGWMGNQPFTESTLIFDTQKEEFAILSH